MIPPIHGETPIFDKPEMWLGKTLEEIIGYRLSLVRGVMNFDNQTPSGRYIELLQELAMAKKPVESEATFEKRAIADVEQVIKNGFNTDSAPFGPVGALKTFRTSSSISVDRRLEDAITIKTCRLKMRYYLYMSKELT